ncbi:hypothetical protein BC628DRAFT_269964 [Trametes gibbosa]|nr:hypothetical protein BC628DRAFT_269964 [Trametes gibbosa]
MLDLLTRANTTPRPPLHPARPCTSSSTVKAYRRGSAASSPLRTSLRATPSRQQPQRHRSFRTTRLCPRKQGRRCSSPSRMSVSLVQYRSRGPCRPPAASSPVSPAIPHTIARDQTYTFLRVRVADGLKGQNCAGTIGMCGRRRKPPRLMWDPLLYYFIRRTRETTGASVHAVAMC